MWIKIRTFGELQILTRASYCMLFFVPILAGVWPAVRVAINRYNEAVTDSKVALQSASQRLEYVALTMNGKTDVSSTVKQILFSLNENLESIISDYSLQTIEKLALPSVWAVAFLASLSVTVGHLVYQAFAPTLIRRTTLREYINDEVRQFVESPSEDRLKSAMFFAKEEQGYKSEEDDVKRTNIIDKESKGRKEITIINMGATGRYRVLARQNIFAAAISGLFYLTGLILIIFIILTQTTKVISAAWGG